MADEPPQPSPEQPPAAPPPPPRRWHHEGLNRRPDQPRSAGKGGKVFAILATMLALIGALVALILYLRPSPPPVVRTIAVTEYQELHFPTNAFAQQDSDALHRHFEEVPWVSELLTGQEGTSASKGFASQTLEALERELKYLQERAEGRKSLVFHLSALALTQGNEVYLLPADAEPDNPKKRLALSSVLAAVQQCGAQHKLLILDILQPCADPRLGALVNDVAERAVAEVEAAVDQDPRLLVLLACSPGQVALVSEDLGLSVLGYYLDEGLRGHADRYNDDRSENGRITVQELYRFVRARVDRWAEENRGTRQTPLLLGQGADFHLKNVEPNQPEEAEPIEPPAEYLEALLKGWQLRDQWKAEGVEQIAPRALRQLEAHLLRAERRWMGGAASPNEIAYYLRNQIDNDCKEQEARARRALLGPSTLRSLALERVDESERKPLEEALQILLKQVEGPKPPPDEKLEKLRKEFQEQQKEVPFPTLARVALDLLAEDLNLSPVKLRLALQLLEEHPQPSPFLETVFLRRLLEQRVLNHGRLADPTWEPVLLKTVRQTLRVLAAREQSTTFDVRVFPWLRGLLDGLTRDSGDLDAQLFGKPWTSLFRLEELVKRLQEMEGDYRTVNRYGEILHRAYQTHDRALTFLPGYVPYLEQQPRLDPGDERLWQQAVDAAIALHLSLLRPDESLKTDALRNRLRDIEGQSDTLNSRLASLSQRFSAEYRKKVLTVAELDALLASPLPSAEERKQLWERQRKRALEQNQATLEADDADNRLEEKLTPEPADLSPAAALQQERDRGHRRARLSVELLKLGGVSDLGELEREQEEAERQRDAQLLQALADRLRQTWGEQALRLKTLMEKNDLTAADRLSRVLHPFDREREEGSGSVGRNPTVDVLRQNKRDLLGWLAGRYSQRLDDPSAPDYYRKLHEQLAVEYSRWPD